jgi:DNA-binding NtrC family response regulator
MGVSAGGLGTMKGGILFVSPSADEARLLAEIMGRVAIPVRQAESLGMARQVMEREAFGAVLTDSRLPDGDWADVVALVEKARPGVAVVVTDRLADARFWADVLQSGAYDLLAKPFYSREVQRVLSNAIHEPPRLIGAAPAA